MILLASYASVVLTPEIEIAALSPTLFKISASVPVPTPLTNIPSKIRPYWVGLSLLSVVPMVTPDILSVLFSPDILPHTIAPEPDMTESSMLLQCAETLPFIVIEGILNTPDTFLNKPACIR